MQRGDTALHLACRANKLETAKWLTEQMRREAALGLNQVRCSEGWVGGRWVDRLHSGAESGEALSKVYGRSVGA